MTILSYKTHSIFPYELLVVFILGRTENNRKTDLSLSRSQKTTESLLFSFFSCRDCGKNFMGCFIVFVLVLNGITSTNKGIWKTKSTSNLVSNSHTISKFQ